MSTDRQLRDVLLREDFAYFVERCFRTLNGSEPYLHNWHIDAIAWQLAQCFNGEINRLIVNLPPRHLKSICVTVAYVTWVLGHRPGTRVIVVSYAHDLTAKLARDIRAVMQSEWYREIFPGTRISDIKNTELEFETTERGSVFATSTGGTLTGRGADLIIIDDPMKANDPRSAEKRNGLIQWYQATLYSRLNNKRRGVIIVVTQRLHVDDLVGYLMTTGTWQRLSIPAIAEETTHYQVGPGRFHRFRQGELLHPEHVDREMLEEARAEQGSYNFAAQYQQNPYPPGGNLIRAEWLHHYDGQPDRSEFELVVCSWDTGSVLGETASYSVCTVWGVLGGRYYLLHVLRERLEYPQLRRAVMEMSRRFDADVTLIERSSAGIPLIQDLYQSGYSGVIPFRPRGDKLSRIEAQSAKFEAQLVLFPTSAPWLADCRSEVLSFPSSRYDDQVDSISQFLEWIGRHQFVRQPIERPNPVRRDPVRHSIANDPRGTRRERRRNLLDPYLLLLRRRRLV